MTARPSAVPPALDPEDAKELLRVAIRKARLHRSERKCAEDARALSDHVLSLPMIQTATCVSVYASRPHEPGTLDLIEALHRRGVRVLLPMLGDGLQRGWGEYRSAEDLMERSPGRPPEPGGEFLPAETIADAQVIVVPALAIDSHGTRLGQGGGWYDRALVDANPDAVMVALVYATEFYDATQEPLPHENHDVVVHSVITPDGITRLPA